METNLDKLYSELSEKGNKEAIELLKKFQEQLKKQSEEIFTELYCGYMPFIESDSWRNFRNEILQGLKNYSSVKNHLSYDFKQIRRVMFEEYKEEIIKDLDQDLIGIIEEKETEIKFLKEHLETLRRY